MKKLRWVMDGGFWDVDVSTPVTLDGLARPVPGDPLPLGLTRGSKLSRPKQIDFFQRFMAAPFVPSFSAHHNGLSLQRVLSLPLPKPLDERWFATFLGQFNIQKFVTSVRKQGFSKPSDSSWLQSLKRHFSEKSLYALNLYSELFLTPEDTILVSYEAYGDGKTPRKKAVLHHKFPHHNLTIESAWPALFLDQHGNYWDVPFALAVDLASVAADSGTSYHLCINHTAGSPKSFEGQPAGGAPATLLPGLCAKCAISYKKNIDIWRSEASMLRLVQPYDIFLSSPHISASATIGTVATASLGENSTRAQRHESPSPRGFAFQAQGAQSAILADLFASVSLSGQHGNFQRMFLDLTRFYARMDFPSGSNFIFGATQAAYNLYNSRIPTQEALRAICPDVTLSFQQQIAGPFSFRVDSGLSLDLKKEDWCLNVKDPVFAIEYALQVLGSAKAVAWYSTKQREFMIELRFFET